MSEMERLRERVTQLEEILEIGVIFQDEFPLLGLTRTQSRILSLLARRELLQERTIFAVLYESRPDCDKPKPDIIKVFICKLRRKLAAHELSIRTRWGVGYYLDAATREALKKTYKIKSSFTLIGQTAST